WNLDAPELSPFFEAAADPGAAILVPPWAMMGPDTMPKYWLPCLVALPAAQSRAARPLLFRAARERRPTLQLCMEHRGRGPPQPPRIAFAALLRLQGRRLEGAGVPDRHLRHRPGDAGHRLPLPPGRTGTRRRHRRPRPRPHRPGPPLPRHRPGMAGTAAFALCVTSVFCHG